MFDGCLANIEGLSLGFRDVGTFSKRQEVKSQEEEKEICNNKIRKEEASARYKNESFVGGYNVDKGCRYGKSIVKTMCICFKCGVREHRSSVCSCNMNGGLL